MKKLIGLILVFVVLVACNTSKKEQGTKKSEIHEILVLEVIQVEGYTYLRAEELGKEIWVAAPTFNAEIGNSYYFKNGLKMPNFESKELNRTFETIYFLDNISTDPKLEAVVKSYESGVDSTQTIDIKPMGKPLTEKEDIKIENITGITTIANLYKNLKSFEGKTIKVKGKVTKFNVAIMNKNWIHIQDGTDFNNEFDLTATTIGEFNVGDIVILKGVVALDKDFGYGYNYKLILEDAVLVK